MCEAINIKHFMNFKQNFTQVIPLTTNTTGGKEKKLRCFLYALYLHAVHHVREFFIKLQTFVLLAISITFVGMTFSIIILQLFAGGRPVLCNKCIQDFFREKELCYLFSYTRG